jgi:hypothetical protein
MFSELPKLFDRDFAVGFLLPAAVFTGAVWFVLGAFDLTSSKPNVEVLTASAVAGVIVFVIAVALLALNYMILRIFEGYPWRQLVSSRDRVWRGRFHKEAAPLLRLQRDFAEGGDPILPSDFSARLLQAVENFPDAEEWVLPTKFGNEFRAFEVYSRVLYGIDEVPMWSRLQSVLPEQFKKQLSESASVLNLFVNSTVGAGITVILYLALASYYRHFSNIGLCIAAVVALFVSYRASLTAVKEYGTHVKSAFDLYRGDLAKQLGFQLPQSAERERDMWRAFSRATIYRSKAHADYLDRFRAPIQPDILGD